MKFNGFNYIYKFYILVSFAGPTYESGKGGLADWFD